MDYKYTCSKFKFPNLFNNYFNREKHIPVVSAFMGILHHYECDNGNVEYYTYDSIPNPEPLLSIKKITMKLAIYYSYLIHNTMVIILSLTYRCFMRDWWQILPEKSIQFQKRCYKYGVGNFVVNNLWSKISDFVPTRAHTKLDDVNQGHAQGIENISCQFSNLYIENN